MITPRTEKLEKLKNNYKLALQKEKKAFEKQFINLAKSLIEFSIKNENFSNDFLKILEKNEVKKIEEQYTKIMEAYK